MNISENEKALISEAIKKVELRTSGEVVPMIVKESDLYPAAHFRLSLVIGLLFSFLCYYGYDFQDPLVLIAVQIPGMLLGYFLAYIPFFKRAFSSKAEMAEEVHQRAIEAFYKSEVSMTKNRTGILIFVSMLEHKIEVLADCGISDEVSTDYWNELVSHLGQKIAQGKLAEGMVQAIENCGEILSTHFPRKENDINEIADKLHL
jgi:putative membrane protein